MSTQVDAPRRRVLRYRPRKFNPLTRARFVKARRERWLRRVVGTPTDTQIELAHSAAVLEWAALQAEHDGSLVSMRDARNIGACCCGLLPTSRRV